MFRRAKERGARREGQALHGSARLSWTPLAVMLILCGLASLWPQSAAAQRRVYRKRTVLAPQPQPRRLLSRDSRLGPYAGLGFLMIRTTTSDNHLTEALHSGKGFSLSAGYRFAPAFAFEGSWSRSWLEPSRNMPISETGVLDGLCFDLLFYPMPGSRRLEPFVDLGVGFYRYERRDWDVLSSELSGMGFQLGGGVALNLTGHLSVVFRALYRGIGMDNTDYEPDAYEENAWLQQWTGEAGLRLTF